MAELRKCNRKLYEDWMKNKMNHPNGQLDGKYPYFTRLHWVEKVLVTTPDQSLGTVGRRESFHLEKPKLARRGQNSPMPAIKKVLGACTRYDLPGNTIYC